MAKGENEKNFDQIFLLLWMGFIEPENGLISEIFLFCPPSGDLGPLLVRFGPIWSEWAPLVTFF